ncbi:hypothetical protein BRD02_07495 [Halobacteriales archaeon QS_8_69_73]|nr:MAG: hypothetical protein BRD02_07495 [Halobacteriales archaeon QS_8_69_73]
MRPVTRNALLVITGLVVALLALGALPGLIRTGDPYYVEATVAAGGSAVAGENLSERRFPYSFGAVTAADDAPGRSEPYYTGVVGFKEAFTHTPFAEFEEFEARTPAAVDRRGDSPTGDVAFLRVDGTRYRLEIVRPPEAA